MNRVKLSNTSKHPVENVTWMEAAEFCNALSRQENLPPRYVLQNEKAEILNTTGYRLVQEIEWEYAATGSKESDWRLTGSAWDKFAWHAGNARNQTHPVGLKPANAFGLFDMFGNVREYVETPGSFCGSCFGDPTANIQPGMAWNNGLNFRGTDVGFRVARSVP